MHLCIMMHGNDDVFTLVFVLGLLALLVLAPFAAFMYNEAWQR